MASYGSLNFAEQIAFFRAKVDLPTERWTDLWQAQHDRAFVVAGALKADLLADLHAAVAKGIDEGTTLETFRQDFEAIVAKHGWTGWTGEGSEAGRAWRTRVIYETNLRSSYAAGRYAQLQAVKTDRPYWEYRHNDSVLHPRPLHVSWDGKVLSADDPWWQTHYPPNGWGCKCRVFALGARDLARMGKDGPDPAPDNGTYEWRGKTIPNGIDPGWAYAPGASWFPDLDRYPYSIARDLVAANLRDGVFERWHGFIAERVAEELAKPEYAEFGGEETTRRLRGRLSRGEAYPVAVMPPARRELIGAETAVVHLSDYDAIKQAYSRRLDRIFTVDAYPSVQYLLDDPELIVREGEQVTVWFRRNGRLLVGIIQQTRSGRGLFLKSLRFGTEADKRRSRAKGETIEEKE